MGLSTTPFKPCSSKNHYKHLQYGMGNVVSTLCNLLVIGSKDQCLVFFCCQPRSLNLEPTPWKENHDPFSCCTWFTMMFCSRNTAPSTATSKTCICIWKSCLCALCSNLCIQNKWGVLPAGGSKLEIECVRVLVSIHSTDVRLKFCQIFAKKFNGWPPIGTLLLSSNRRLMQNKKTSVCSILNSSSTDVLYFATSACWKRIRR